MNIESLRSQLSYDPESGKLTWRSRPFSHFKDAHSCNAWNGLHAGKEAGTLIVDKNTTYRQVTVCGKTMRTHRIIWAIVTGEIPNVIDHINHNGLDNRFENLRNVTNLENSRNKRPRPGRTLPMGVRPLGKKFNVKISVNRTHMEIGTFDTLDEAVKARKSAHLKYGFHPNHGE